MYLYIYMHPPPPHESIPPGRKEYRQMLFGGMKREQENGKNKKERGEIGKVKEY
jgi:hypothetical protein